MAEASYAVSLENKLKSFTLSAPAAHWVTKALHPVWGAPSQIPDSVQVDTVIPEYKNTLVISCPVSINTGNWDLFILLPPSDTQAALYAIGPAGTNFNTAAYNPGGSTGVVTSGVLQNTSLAASASFNAWSMVGVGTGTLAVGGRGLFQGAYSTEAPSAWRTTARSATLYASGSDLYNQGTIYAGQYARKVRPSSQGAWVQPYGIFSNGWAYNVDYVDLPMDESVMALLTPNMYTSPARDGVYTVHRLTGPAQDFATARALGPFDDPGMTSQWFPAFGRNSDDGSVAHQFSLTFGPSNQPSPLFAGDPLTVNRQQQIGSTGWDDHCSWGVIICRGLHPLMSMTLKTICDLELVPTDQSPNRQFVLPSCKYEPTAMAAYYAIASEAPTCMAAKHNLFGTLIPILSSIASKVLPFLAPMASQLISSFTGGGGGGGSQAPAADVVKPPRMIAPPRPRVARASSVSSRVSRASTRSVRSKKKKVRVARRH